VLIVARFLEGAMAGLMVPQILAIIHACFPLEERGKAFGMWGGVLGLASVAGLVVGGLLVRWNPAGLEWRSIFLVNVPVGVAALAAAGLVIRESRAKSAARPDYVGMVLAVTGVLMVVYPLYEGRRLGWPAWIFALMAGGLAVLFLFVAYERRRSRTVGSPLVEMRLFRSRAFSAGLAVWLVFRIALAGFSSSGRSTCRSAWAGARSTPA
jgi:MFS family permease